MERFSEGVGFGDLSDREAERLSEDHFDGSGFTIGNPRERLGVEEKAMVVEDALSYIEGNKAKDLDTRFGNAKRNFLDAKENLKDTATTLKKDIEDVVSDIVDTVILYTKARVKPNENTEHHFVNFEPHRWKVYESVDPGMQEFGFTNIYENSVHQKYDLNRFKGNGDIDNTIEGVKKAITSDAFHYARSSMEWAKDAALILQQARAEWQIRAMDAMVEATPEIEEKENELSDIGIYSREELIGEQ